MYRNNIVENAL